VAPAWTNFAIITGSAAGALTGLLFVAVSLNRERIAGHLALRGQAGQTLVLFMLPLLLSVLLVLPGTTNTGFGVGLVVLALVAGVVMLLAGHGKEKRVGRGEGPVGRGEGPVGRGREREPAGAAPEDLLSNLLDRASPNLVVLLLILVAGCLQLAGVDGLYWIAASSVVCLVSGVFNAWLFLTR
jgi:modulator of FtsH protease